MYPTYAHQTTHYQPNPNHNRFLVHLQILLKPLKLGLGGVNTLDSLVGERELVDLDRGGGPGERRRDSRGSIGGGQVRKESLGEVSVESI